jgi:hypothetical protein
MRAEANPGLVKTMSVMPPMGQGRVRLVRIGQGADQIDLQPCGGTHVARTAEDRPGRDRQDREEGPPEPPRIDATVSSRRMRPSGPGTGIGPTPAALPVRPVCNWPPSTRPPPMK